jgi:tellurite resistance protein TehA-like permease
MDASNTYTASSRSNSDEKGGNSSISTSNDTNNQKEERVIAVTSNSPSLSPLNAPQLPTSKANREGIDDDTEFTQDEVGLALAFGAGEPIKGGLDGLDNSIGLTKEESIALEGERLGGAQNDNGVDSDKQEKGEEKDDEKGNRSIGLSLRGKVLHFTPSWFSVTMGTGVIATLLTLLGQIWGTERYSPFFRSFIRWPALVYLLVDVAIFIIFSASFLARYILFPQVLPLTIKHPQKSMFLGTVPMGLITITSGICQLGTTSFDLGMWPTFVAVGLFFFCCLLSTIVALGVPWSIVTYQKGHRFEGTTAALLLPVVPPITAAALASVISEHLIERYPTLAFTVMVVGYMQLGIGLPLAMMILVLYLQRLILFKAPPREVIVSVFLPLGPCGQGGEAALHLGRVAMLLFPRISSTPTTGVPQLTIGVGEAFYGAGMVAALLLFALGIWWLMMGTATFFLEWKRGYLKFNMGFWSFTFPLASLAICTARLAIELDSLTLKIVYTGFVLGNFMLWVSVAIPTVKGFFSGNLLIAPCIADLPLDPLLSKR